MIPKKFSKILTASILPLLMASSIIPIAHASDPAEKPSSRVTRASTSQPPETSSAKTAIPLRRVVSEPEYGSERYRLLTEEPIPAPSVMVRRSPSIPKRREQPAQDIAVAKMDALSEALIPLSQPVAGFIPLSGHLCSQVDASNADAALARLDIDTMKTKILPAVDDLLEHSWTAQPAATLDIKDDLVAVVEQLKAGKPQEESTLSTALIEKVNKAEESGPLDEFSRLGLYSVQTVLHLLAGTPYAALNNFLELRQLGISWHSSSLLIDKLFRKGEFYKHLSDFVSSDKADSIWPGDKRICKLWQGHALFAWNQHESEKISKDLSDLRNAAGSEGELTFRHTCYVLGKMQLHFGEHSFDNSLLEAAQQTLTKIDGYHFEGLFSYRNAATKVFLGDAAWARSNLGNQLVHLTAALTYYKDALRLIESDNGTGADMIRSSFDHAEGVIQKYAEAPESVIANGSKIENLKIFREELKKLTPPLRHIDIPRLTEIVETELRKLVADAVPKHVVTAPQKKKESDKKRKDRDFDKKDGQRQDYEDSQLDVGGDYLDLWYDEYQQPPVKSAKK